MGQSLAQNRENGRTPSLANSCFTVRILLALYHSQSESGNRPLPFANTCENTFPSDESEMMTGSTRVTNVLGPQTWHS